MKTKIGTIIRNQDGSYSVMTDIGWQYCDDKKDLDEVLRYIQTM